MDAWRQVYDPFSNPLLSTTAAATPPILLLILIGSGRLRPHLAAILALGVALLIAVFLFTMPPSLAIRATLLGAVTGFFPIGWIILNVLFLYRLTLEKGWFGVLQESIAGITNDRRIQLLLIAFCFGAFFEGVAGFGTPVAITASILIGLRFSPLAAAGLSLIANTAPVAFGALGAPIQGLAEATGLDPNALGAMVGRQVPIFSVIVPFWLIAAFDGWRGIRQTWPAIVTAGVSFAIPQFLVSNFVNPWIVDIVASLFSMFTLVQLLRIWKPTASTENSRIGPDAQPSSLLDSKTNMTRSVWLAYSPWIILSVVLTIWATDWFKKLANKIFALTFHIQGLHELIERVPPVVLHPTREAAVFNFTFVSYTGTGILAAAILSGLLMFMSPLRIIRIYFQTLWLIRYSLLTIAAMLAFGTLTRYSGTDATLGLAFAHAGIWYPFFGTLLGWLGVAATGSDTASNILFGSLQKITAQQLGLSPILMAAANSSGGVMGKMIDTQSIVVATTAVGWFGHEGRILRFVILHSIVLASLVGGLVMLQAYVWPFVEMIPR